MAMATESIIVTSNAATSATPTVHHAKCSGPKPADDEPVPAPFSAKLRRVCGHCLRVAAAILVGYSFAVTAWRDRLEPKDLAVVAAASMLLTALLMCIRRVERLTPDSTLRARRCVLMAVWVLTTALCSTFVYTVAALMPHGLAVLVWCMTAFVVLVGFYLLVLCKHQQYPALEDDVDTNPAVELV